VIKRFFTPIFVKNQKNGAFLKNTVLRNSCLAVGYQLKMFLGAGAWRRCRAVSG